MCDRECLLPGLLFHSDMINLANLLENLIFNIEKSEYTPKICSLQ